MNPFAIFTAAKTVANPTAWARGQVTTNQLLTVLTVAAYFLKGTRYEVPDDVLGAVAAGLFAVVNWLFTVAQHPIDVLGRPAAAAPVAGAAGDGAAPPAAAPAPGLPAQATDPTNIAGG